MSLSQEYLLKTYLYNIYSTYLFSRTLFVLNYTNQSFSCAHTYCYAVLFTCYRLKKVQGHLFIACRNKQPILSLILYKWKAPDTKLSSEMLMSFSMTWKPFGTLLIISSIRMMYLIDSSERKRISYRRVTSLVSRSRQVSTRLSHAGSLQQTFNS